MLTKRIIPCLDVKNFRTVKGVNFQNLRDAGDAVELAKFYSENGADELVFLDISATLEGRGQFIEFIEKVAAQISIPFTVGGGISCIEDMEKCFRAGADKIAMNSAAVKNPDLIRQAANKFGSQAVVISVDIKKISSSRPEDGVLDKKERIAKMALKQSKTAQWRTDSKRRDLSPLNKRWSIHTHGGTKDTGLDALEFIKQVQDLGAGEIMLTSMDADGTKDGFDIPALTAVKEIATVPVIASGGAGTTADFVEIFENDLADAGLAASIFHFNEIGIGDLKSYLKEEGVCVRQ